MHTEHKLKPDAPDAVLLAAMADWPRGDLLLAVQAEAVAAHRSIMKWPFAAVLGVDAFFGNFQDATNRHRAHPGAFPEQHRAYEAARLAQLRLAIDARDALLAVLEDLGKLSAGEHLSLGRAMAFTSGSPGQANARIRAVMSAHPGLAAFQARRDAELQRVTDAQHAQQDRMRAIAAAEHAQGRVEAARVLLRRLAQAGIVLTSSPEGIAARPAMLLTAADLAELKELRAEMATLLDAPAAMVA